MCIIGFIHFYSSRDQVESILEITCQTHSIKDVAMLVVERSGVGRIVIQPKWDDCRVIFVRRHGI